MAALIWDNELQAFTEAATPKIWDPALGAYEDTAGLVWNPELEAWEEGWNPEKRLYLYKQGDKCASVAGGWLNFEGPDSNLSVSWGNDCFTLKNDSAGGSTNKFYAGIVTAGAVDMTLYSSAHISVRSAVGNASRADGLSTYFQVAEGTRYTDKIIAGIWIYDGSMGDISFDISGVAGKYWVRVNCYTFGASITADSVWLEK